jgi:hypothetical protein
MTKLNRLLPFDPLACIPGGTIDFGAYPKCRKQDENGAENTEFGERVGAVVKDLWHRRRFANPIRDY